MKTIPTRLSALAASVLAAAVLAGSFVPAANAATEMPETPGLKDVYEDHFRIGTVISPNDWAANGGAKWEHMLKHYNAVTPENATKPDNIWRGDSETGRPAEAPTGFESADALLTRANEAGFYTIGHALAWHNQSRYWPARSADRNTLTSDMDLHWDYEEARSQLQNYIATIAGRYSEGPYKLNAWDVVNEAMRDNPENPTDWRNALRSLEQPKFRAAAWAGAYADGGNAWDYVYDSFVFARQADPDAVLYYNDFNDLELPNKAIAIASMVTELNEKYAQEYPEDEKMLIQGIGIQAHYNTRLDLDNLEEVLQIYIETGAEISLTELDLSITGTQDSGGTVPPTDEQLQVQADMYAKLFILLKKYSDHIERVSFWGTSDSNSWRSSFFPLAFSRSGDTWTEKPAYYAMVDPEGWLGFEKERPELGSFTFQGEVFDFDSEKTEYDVHVPDEISSVDFSAENIVHGYGEELNVDVSLDSPDCTVSPSGPCVATVEAAWASEPGNASTYTINFGHMAAEWEDDVNYPDTGYRSAVNVRFSDGSSDINLFQEFIREGDRPEFVTAANYPAPAKHGSARLVVGTDSQIADSDLVELTVRKHVWDHAWAPMTAARVTDLSQPQSTWEAADSIEHFATYLVVAAEAGQALTHEGLDPVPAGDGISEARQGYYGTPVVVEGDTVVDPETVQDNMRWLFTETESSDPGPYTEANGYTGYTMMSLVHGGLIQPFNIHRENDPDRVNTDALRSDRLVGDANLDRAVWFNTGLQDGETTLFTHTASSEETYALHGTSAGFVAEGGTGELTEYVDASRLTLYEYVAHEEFEEADGLGVDIEIGPVDRVVGDLGVQYEIPVTADVEDGRQAVLLKDGASVATATFVNGESTLQVDESDVEPGATYAVAVLDDADVLGATSLPADFIVAPVEVTPVAATFDEQDGTEGDSFTIPEVEGVEYVVDGDVVEAGTYPGAGTVTVTARALDGFVLADGADTEWSHTFSTEGGGQVPQPPSSAAEFHLSDNWRGTTHHFFKYGRIADEVFVGDWDGDGTDSIALRRGNVFHVSNAPRGGDADWTFRYGRAGDSVLVGDWDGDGRDTFAVRRGSEYHVKNHLLGGAADVVFHYGRADDDVLVGDWDGDDLDTLAVRRGNVYHVRNSVTGGPADQVFGYGRAGDVTLVGDWNGDGLDTMAVRRGATYHVKNSLTGGHADLRVTFGRANDEVFVGDWNGDGSDTLGIRRGQRTLPWEVPAV